MKKWALPSVLLILGLFLGLGIGSFKPLPIISEYTWNPLTIQVSPGESWAWHWKIAEAVPVENFASERSYVAFTEPESGFLAHHAAAVYLRNGSVLSGVILTDGRCLILRRKSEGNVISEVLLAYPKDRALLPASGEFDVP